MLIISDTNILSSLAAGDGLHLLWQLFASTVIYIPPTVEQELQAGLAHGQAHLNVVLKAISSLNIQILPLSPEEQQLADTLPKKIKGSEREAVALSQTGEGILLSNHRRTIRYCDRNEIDALDLIDILRLLRQQQIIPKYKIKELILRMEQVE
jgi:predicted nucleic acid-binding protein